MPRKIQRYGWIPDLPDHRDFFYAAPIPTLRALPTSIDLSPQCPPVYDQGQLGSCTGNAIAGAIHFDRLKQNIQPDFIPSRLFIYYNERDMEGTVGTDSGGQIRDGIKSVAAQGVCPEDPPPPDWSYDISQFAAKPPADWLSSRAPAHNQGLFQVAPGPHPNERMLGLWLPVRFWLHRLREL